MSHVTDMQLHIKDLGALAAAGVSLGMEFVEQPQFKWYGTHMGDYPLPEGFTKADMGKCDYVLRLKGNKQAYEVGVCKRRDGKPGYQLLWDFWQGGYGLQAAIGKDGQGLKQAYGAAVANKHMQKLSLEGFRTMKYKRADGSVVVKAVRG